MTEELGLAFVAGQVIATVLEDQVADKRDEQEQEDAQRIESESDADTVDADQRTRCRPERAQRGSGRDRRNERDNAREPGGRQRACGTAAISRGSRKNEGQAGEAGQESEGRGVDDSYSKRVLRRGIYSERRYKLNSIKGCFCLPKQNE